MAETAKHDHLDASKMVGKGFWIAIARESVLTRLWLAVLVLCLSVPVWAKKHRRGYRKATEGQVVVLRKLFPKKKSLEINANFGAILNQSFVDTMMLHGGVSYHFSEEWGIALEGAMAMNSDKTERQCIESFYNNFDEDKPLKAKCVIQDGGALVKGKDPSASFANIGPAYMPIIEIDKLFSLSAVWSPVYGKQIFSFLPRTSHMDIFITFGGGMAMSTFYAQRETLANGNKARYKEKITTNTTPWNEHGASFDQKTSWGVGGRPPADQPSNVFLSFGVGQKYYFLKRLFIKVELRNFTMLGTSEGYHNFFTMWGGLGFRL